jgi:FkbM family methyltransferase
MKLMHNGWYVPDDDQKITRVLENDKDKINPSYEGKYRQHILDNLPNKRTFVDVGAKVGIWSFPLIGKFSKIIGYEPSKQNIECLKANIKDGVEIRTKALADFVGEADFHQAGKNCGDGKLSRPGAKSSYTVPVVRLDDECLTEVDLIKIDVQGWELEVLRGGKELLAQQQPWVIFEVNQDIDVCCEFMQNLNYETIYVKSKRVFLWAPKSGHNRPADSKQFGRYLGPGPYAERYGGK